jgi:hypothetical protein
MGIVIEIPFRASEATALKALDEAFNITGPIERPPQQLRFRFNTTKGRSDINRGSVKSPETRAKISQKLKSYHAQRRAKEK